MSAAGEADRVAAVRARFESDLDFPLDPFQSDALDALDAGQSVLVAAPTGAGKTLVAEYAIALALAKGEKAFYTTPLKALSNQKYTDFSRELGADNVGLLTGDNSVNGEAPVVVMTTEVLRNMIYAQSPTLAGLRYVILDEVHYLQNRYRGAVWEEVIIHLPHTVDLVCLSATVSNAEDFAAWIQTVRGETRAIIEERRPVELNHLYAAGERDTEALHLLPTFVGPTDDLDNLRPNPEAARLDGRAAVRGAPLGPRGRPRTRLFTPGRVELVERLRAEHMLPAIFFIFSRNGCDQAVQQCLAGGPRLTSGAERAQIRDIVEAKTAHIADDDLDVLGFGSWMAGLEAGYAAHHAGMVPPMKEAVEEAFTRGLVKVVFATETLSLGINMPARTVVIEKLSKFTGETHEFLTPGEYTQLAGRAGRRGIDDVGYVVVCWSPFVPFEQVAGLASRRTYALTSSFRPNYNMAVNLVSRYGTEEAHHLLNLSFAQFQADRAVVALERRLELSRQQLAKHREAARTDVGDVYEYRRIATQVETERREVKAGKHVNEALATLEPGDILLGGRKAGRVVVLKVEYGRGATKALVLTPGRDLVRLSAADFNGPPRVIGRLHLPARYAPRSQAFRRTVAESLRKARVQSVGQPVESAQTRLDDLTRRLESHPVHTATGLQGQLRAAASVERIERDITKMERRVEGRTESLARQFDRVLRVLERWGYVDEWNVTDAGAILSRIYSEADLVLAEAMRTGLLDGLTPAELAGLVSCATFESRGSDGPTAPGRWPSHELQARCKRLERIWRDLSRNEDDAGLPETRAPDPGFAAFAHDWADGDDLADLLEDEEMTGGDFVRNIKQIIDLLRQIAEVAPDPGTREAAHRAADSCFRGVIAASSVVSSR